MPLRCNPFNLCNVVTFPSLHNLKRGALPVPRGRAGKQSANGLNGLAVAANDPADIGLPQLHPEDRGFSRRNLREHHLIGEFNQLANDELEKLFHEVKVSALSARCKLPAFQGAAVFNRRLKTGRFQIAPP